MGESGAAAVQALLQSVNKPAQGVLGTIVGGASCCSARCRCSASCRTRSTGSGARRRAPQSGLWSLVRSRLLSFGMVLGIGFLLIVSLVASAGVAALGKFSAPLFGRWASLAEVLNFVVSFALVTVTFALIYKVMPRVRIGWRDVWLGAAVTALLFAIGKSLIGLYLGRAGFASGFGAAGSLSCCWSGCTTRRRSSCSAPSSRGSTRMPSARASAAPDVPARRIGERSPASRAALAAALRGKRGAG